MLLHKDITKTQEIKTLFQETWKQPEFFVQHLKLYYGFLPRAKRQLLQGIVQSKIGLAQPIVAVCQTVLGSR